MAERSTTFKLLFTGDVGGLKGASDEAGGALDGLASKAGTAALGVGAALAGLSVAGGAALLKLGSSFDDAYDTIAVGTGATGETLEGLEESFKNVFTSVPTDMGAAAQAIADLNTRTGASGPALEGMASTMLEMTRITGGDLTSNIESVTRVMGDWGTEGQATMDKLFIASQSTGIGVDKLANQMVTFGAPMRQLGFDFDTTAALLGKFEKEGVNAELVMGSMRIALGKMAKDGIPAQEGLLKTVEAIQSAGSVSEANAMAIELFGARAGPDMAAAIREGRFSVDELVKTLGESDGAIMDAAANTSDFGEKWRVTMNKVMVAFEPLAMKALDFANILMDKLAPVIEDLSEWLAENLPRAFEAVQAAGEKALPYIAEAFDLIREAGQKVLDVLQPVFDFFAENKEAQIAAAAAAVGIMTLAMAALAVSAGAAAVSMVAANAPIIALIAAVGAVAAGVVMLIRHWDEITAKFPIINTVIDAVKGPLQAFAGWITGTFVPDMVTIGTGIMDAIGAAVGYVQQHWGTIWSTMQPILDTMKIGVQLAFDNIKVVIETAFGVIQGIYETFMGIFTGDWDRAWNGIKDIFGAVVDGFAGLIENALTAIADLVRLWGPKLIQMGKDIANWIGDQVAQLPSRMVGLGEDVVRGLWNGIINLKEWLIEQAKGFAGGVIDGFKSGFGIFSPSKVMAQEVGIPIAQGVAVGMTQGFNQYVVPTIEQLAENAAALAAIKVNGPQPLTGAYVPNGLGLLPGQNIGEMPGYTPWFTGVEGVGKGAGVVNGNDYPIPFGEMTPMGPAIGFDEVKAQITAASGRVPTDEEVHEVIRGMLDMDMMSLAFGANDYVGGSYLDYHTSKDLLGYKMAGISQYAKGGAPAYGAAVMHGDSRGGSGPMIVINVQGSLIGDEQHIKQIIERALRRAVN